MITNTHTTDVNRSAEETFDVIGTNVFENHPKWEPEYEYREITPGPIGVGTSALMVRHGWLGRTTESELVVTEFEPGQRIAVHHADPVLDFRLSFDVTPVDANACTVRTEVQAQPRGWMRILEPIMRLDMPKRTERTTDAMVEVIERESVRS